MNEDMPSVTSMIMVHSGSHVMAVDSGVHYQLCMYLHSERMGIVDSGMGAKYITIAKFKSC